MECEFPALSTILTVFTLLSFSCFPVSYATPHTTYTNFAEPEAFTLPTEYTFSSTADTDTISLTINDDYIYRYAFISYSGQSWQQVDLTGSLSTHYITDLATATIPISPADFGLTTPGQTKTRNYIVTYTCDSSVYCHDGWQIRQFDATLEDQTPSWQQGLVSWWKLDDNADDSVGDNHGTVSGASTCTDCISGSCYAFDGVEDSIIIPSSAEFDFPVSGTVSIWVNALSSTTNYDIPFYRGGTSAANSGYDFELGSGSWYSGVTNGTGYKSCYYSYSPLSGWNMLTFTFDTTTNEMICYVNGTGSSPTDITGFGPLSSIRDIYLGSSHTGNYDFNGSIDEVMLWDRALSSSEVAAIYASFGYVPPSCTDTCLSLGYECGMQTICGSSVDCGTCTSGTCNSSGQCAASATCNDGTQNQGEEGIDCGGPCPACFTGNTYYVSPSGSNSNPGIITQPFLTINYALSRIEGGDRLYVRDGTYNERLIINGIDGSESSPTVISAYPGEHPIIDGTGIEITAGSYLMMVYSSYVHITGLEVVNVNRYGTDGIGGGGIVLIGAHNLISNCILHDLWGSAITVLGDYSIVEYCTIYDASLKNEDGNSPTSWSAAIRVGRDKVDGVTDYAVIRNVLVHDVWGEGITLGSTSYSTIEDCIVYDVFSVNFYMLNTYHGLFQRNVAYHTKRMADGDQVCIGHWNELVDEIMNENNTIINNIAYGCRRNFYNACPLIGTLIANNVFVNSSYFASVQLSGGDHVSGTFANNIIIQGDSIQSIYFPDDNDVIFSNNLYNKNYNADAVGPGDIVADPGFAKVGGTGPGELTAEYFKLLSDSPAIDAGAVLAPVSEDYFRNPRDSNPDIGACEYQG